MMDISGHVLDDPFTCQLWEELDLEEISQKVWWGSPPNTHISGSKLIDVIWASRSLEIGGFEFLSFSKSVGDHRTIFLMYQPDRLYVFLNIMWSDQAAEG